jgi:hypothetical protein
MDQDFGLIGYDAVWSPSSAGNEMESILRTTAGPLGYH